MMRKAIANHLKYIQDMPLNSLKSINARCLVMDSKDKCSFINYYMTGLRNDIDDSLKYLPTDDGFIYDPAKVVETIQKYDNELYILNYEIDSCKTFEEMQDRLNIETGKISSNISFAGSVGSSNLSNAGNTIISVNFYPQKMTEAELDNAFNYINKRFGMAY